MATQLEGIQIPFSVLVKDLDKLEKLKQEILNFIKSLKNETEISLTADIELDTSKLDTQLRELSKTFKSFNTQIYPKLDTSKLKNEQARLQSELRRIMDTITVASGQSLSALFKDVHQFSIQLKNVPLFKQLSAEQKTHLQKMTDNFADYIRTVNLALNNFKQKALTTYNQITNAIGTGNSKLANNLIIKLKEQAEDVTEEIKKLQELKVTISSAIAEEMKVQVTPIKTPSVQLAYLTERIGTGSLFSGVPLIKQMINSSVEAINQLRDLEVPSGFLKDFISENDVKLIKETESAFSKLQNMISEFRESAKILKETGDYGGIVTRIKQVQSAFKEYSEAYRKYVTNIFKSSPEIDIKLNLKTFTEISARTEQYKKKILNLGAYISNNNRLLESRKAIINIINQLIKSGVDIEAQVLTKKIQALNVDKRIMEYTKELARTEQEIANSPIANTSTGYEIRKNLIQEQINALKLLYTTMGDTSSADKLYEKLTKLEKKKISLAGLENFRKQITRIGIEIEKSPLKGIQKLLNAITRLEVSTGKPLKSFASESKIVNNILAGLIKQFNEIGSKPFFNPEEVVKYKTELLGALSVISKLNILPIKQQTILQRFVREQQASLSIIKEQVEAEAKILQNLEKVVALQSSGVEGLKNLQQIQNLYIEAKKKGLSLDDALISKIQDMNRASAGLYESFRRVYALAQDKTLLPEQQLAQLKSAQKILDLIAKLPVKSFKTLNGNTITKEEITFQRMNIVDDIKNREAILAIDKEIASVDKRINKLYVDKVKFASKLTRELSRASDVIRNSISVSKEYNRLLANSFDAIAQGLIDIPTFKENLPQLRKQTITSLVEEYKNLKKINLEDLNTTREKIVYYEKLKTILTSLKNIGVKNYQNLLPKSLVGEGLSAEIENIETSLAKLKNAKLPIDNLTNYREQLKSIKENISKLSLDTRVKRDFFSISDSLNALSRNASSLKTSLNKLYQEQLKNKDATSLQRIETLKYMSALDSETATISKIKSNLTKLNEVLGKKGISLDELLIRPGNVFEKFKNDTKFIDSLINKLQTLKFHFNNLGVNASLIPELETLNNSVKNFKPAFENAFLIVSNFADKYKETAKINEELAKKQENFNYQLQKTLNLLLQGQDVLGNWEKLLSLAKQKLKEGGEITGELLVALDSKNEQNIKLLQNYINRLQKVLQSSSQPISVKGIAIQELEKARLFASQKLGVSLQVDDKVVAKVKDELETLKQKGELIKLNESLRQAERKISVLANELSKSFTNISPEETYKGLTIKTSLYIDQLKKIKNLQIKLLKNEEYLASASQKEVDKKKQEVVEINELLKLFDRMETINRRLRRYSTLAGIDVSKIKDFKDIAKLDIATKKRPRLYLDIYKSNEEFKNLTKTILATINNSETLAKKFKTFTPILETANQQAENIHKNLQVRAQLKEAQAKKSAGSQLFDVFRLSWFIQLRLFWQAYLMVGKLNQQSMEYLKTLATIKSVTGTTAKETKLLEGSFKGLANGIAYALTEMASAELELAKAGFSVEESLQLLEEGSKLAYATGSALSSASDILITVMHAWNTQTSQAENITNQLFATIANSKASLDSLKTALGYVSSVAPQTNTTLSEILAMVAVLSNAGLQASKSGTYLRRFFTEILNPSKKLTQSLAKFNISLSDIDPRTRSVLSILEELKQKGFDTAEAFGTMDIRSASAFSLLLNNLDVLKEMNDLIETQTGLIYGYGTATDTLTAKLTMFGNRLTVIYADIIKNTTPVTTGMLEGVEDITSSLLSFISWLTSGLGSMSFESKRVATSLTSASTSITILSLAVMGLIRVLPKAITLMKYLLTLGGYTGVVKGLTVILSLITAIASYKYFNFDELDRASAKLDDIKDKLLEIQKLGKNRIQLRLEIGKQIQISQASKFITDFYDAIYKEIEKRKGNIDFLGSPALQVKLRSQMRVLITDLLQSEDQALKDLGKQIQENLFKIGSSPEEIKKFIDETRNVALKLQGITGSSLETLSKNIETSLSVVPEVYKSLNKQLIKLGTTLQSTILKQIKGLAKLQKEAEKTSTAILTKETAKDVASAGFSPVYFLVKGWKKANVDLSKLAYKLNMAEFLKLDTAETKIKELLITLKKFSAGISTISMSLPNIKESEPAIDNAINQINMLRKYISAFNKQGGLKLMTPAQQAELANFLTALDKLEAKLKVKKATIIKTAENLTSELEEKAFKVDEATVNKFKQSFLKDIENYLKEAKELATGLKLKAQLTLAQPSKQNIAGFIKNLQKLVEKQRIVVEAIVMAGGVGELTTPQLENFISVLKNSWEGFLNDLKRSSKSLNFDNIISKAGQLYSALDFRRLGIGFDGFVRLLKIGDLAVKEFRDSVNQISLQTFDELNQKIEKTVKVLAYIQKHKRAFDNKQIKQIVQLFDTLTNNQLNFIKAINSSYFAINRAFTSYQMLKQTQKGIFVSPEIQIDTKTLQDYAKSISEISFKYNELSSTFTTIKEKYTNLNNLVNKNTKESIKAQKEFANLGKTASANLENIITKTNQAISKLIEFRNKARDIGVNLAKDQLEYYKSIKDYQAELESPNYQYFFETQKLNAQVKFTNEAIQSGIDTGQVIDLLKELRNSYLEYAKNYKYQAGGKDALKKSFILNRKIVELQKIQQALAIKRGQLELARIRSFETFAQETVSLLAEIRDILKLPKDTPITKNKLVNEIKSTKQPTKTQLESKKVISLTEEINNLNNAIAKSKAQFDNLNLNLQETTITTLGIQEAFLNWAKTLGDARSITQSAFNDMMNSIKNFSSNLMSQTVQYYVTGGESGSIDYWQMWLQMYGQIMDRYFNLLIDQIINALASNQTWGEIFGSLLGSADTTKKQLEKATEMQSLQTKLNMEIMTAQQVNTMITQAGLQFNASVNTASTTLTTSFTQFSSQIINASIQAANSLIAGAQSAGAILQASASASKFYTGGIVKGYSAGGSIEGAFSGKVNDGVSGKDSVFAMLAKDEFVIRNRNAKALGFDVLTYLNTASPDELKQIREIFLAKKIEHRFLGGIITEATAIKQNRKTSRFDLTKKPFEKFETSKIDDLKKSLLKSKGGVEKPINESMMPKIKEVKTKIIKTLETSNNNKLEPRLKRNIEKAIDVRITNVIDQALAKRFVASDEGRMTISNIIDEHPVFRKWLKIF